MRIIKELIRRMLVLPILGIQGEGGTVDMEELNRIVRERTARAERSVLRDYFAQLGLSEEQAKEAENAYKAEKSASEMTAQKLAEAEERAKLAEKTARQAQTASEARVQMALLGVREECFTDVLRLAAEGLSEAEGETGADSEKVRAAIEKVIERIPSFTGEVIPHSTGTMGRFPRGNSAAESYRQLLNRARETHDNAAAAAIISRAAEKGINLR